MQIPQIPSGTGISWQTIRAVAAGAPKKREEREEREEHEEHEEHEGPVDPDKPTEPKGIEPSPADATGNDEEREGDGWHPTPRQILKPRYK